MTQHTDKPIIIAIDGHSSCGKSTMAKALAKRLDYTYVDTGAMYRAVTLYALRQGYIAADAIDETSLQNDIDRVSVDFGEDGKVRLNGESVESEIRGMEVSSSVSRISALPFVRRHLVACQRKMGERKRLVMDGRDIGTVVFPNAELKIFVTADAEVRAQRRYDELTAKGEPCVYEEVLANVKERDYLDEHRADSPLHVAEDAIVLDNSHLTIRQQNNRLMSLYRACQNRL
ncbi:MAG: (d)CMP kinase [Paludibacteraceae bacterium]|nr:(d)CMP kinase [Paludibacteraceae bacterium]